MKTTVRTVVQTDLKHKNVTPKHGLVYMGQIRKGGAKVLQTRVFPKYIRTYQEKQNKSWESLLKGKRKLY